VGKLAIACTQPQQRLERQSPEEAAKAHRAQGYADGLQGFTATRNPWPEGTRAQASYHEGWVEGNAKMEEERAAPPSRRRRRRTGGPQHGCGMVR